MENETKKVELSSWNLSMAIITELAGLLSNASGSFVRRDYETTLQNLEAIRLRLAANINNEEREDFMEIEIKLHKLFGIKVSIDPLSREASKNWFTEHVPKIHKLLDEYNWKIMIALKKYGLLIPPKVDKTKMLA